MVREISTTSGQPTIFIPLSIIIIFSGIKDIFEDYKRHKADREENESTVEIFSEGKWQPTLWKNLLVGNLIRLKSEQYSPADIVILSSSDRRGYCYIETKNLDGETNLKHKRAHKDILSRFNDLSTYTPTHHNSVALEYEKPNPYLYQFNGLPLKSCAFYLTPSLPTS